jgi:hypothetical protein
MCRTPHLSVIWDTSAPANAASSSIPSVVMTVESTSKHTVRALRQIRFASASDMVARERRIWPAKRLTREATNRTVRRLVSFAAVVGRVAVKRYVHRGGLVRRSMDVFGIGAAAVGDSGAVIVGSVVQSSAADCGGVGECQFYGGGGGGDSGGGGGGDGGGDGGGAAAGAGIATTSTGDTAAPRVDAAGGGEPAADALQRCIVNAGKWLRPGQLQKSLEAAGKMGTQL